MKDKKLLIAAVVLILVAGALIAFQMRGATRLVTNNPGENNKALESQIAEIQNNTHMPENMKATAIGRIRSHMTPPSTLPQK